MSFNPLTKNQIRLRQWGKCARCGESLHDTEEFAHPLYPQSQGGPEKEENCVMLCPNCQNTAENDPNSQSCMTAPLGYFPFANIFASHKQAQARVSRR